MFFFQKNKAGIDFLIVGLGNPGKEYEQTRHNVGFLVVDELARRKNVSVGRLKYKALTETVSFGSHRAFLMKPVTYINLSGESVSAAAHFFKLPPEKILVISDDVDLLVGKLRLRRRGSAGGHNGLKSIIQHLGTDQFPRVKLGIGSKPHPDYEMANWVLSRFSTQDQSLIRDAVSLAADAVELFATHGIDAAMSQYNGS